LLETNFDSNRLLSAEKMMKGRTWERQQDCLF